MSESGRPLRRARALSAALLAVVFVVGGLVGAAADRAIDPRSHKHGRQGREAEMLERLRLAEPQKSQVETILARRRAEAGAIWSEVKPRLNRIVADTRQDLSRVLTPEQLAEYDRWMAERSRRMERRFESENQKGKGEGGTS
jgi:Spy/CpxP family protein refolding chaperone